MLGLREQMPAGGRPGIVRCGTSEGPRCVKRLPRSPQQPALPASRLPESKERERAQLGDQRGSKSPGRVLLLSGFASRTKENEVRQQLGCPLLDVPQASQSPRTLNLRHFSPLEHLLLLLGPQCSTWSPISQVPKLDSWRLLHPPP